MIREHHLPIRRTARYHVLGEGAGPPREIRIVLHGYAQLAAAFLREFEMLDDGRSLVVAPEGLSRFYLEAGRHGPESRVGASRMTREDRLTEIDDYVGYLDDLHRTIVGPFRREALRVTVLGFSQGAATASRWVVRGRSRIDRLGVWAGLLPPDVDPREFREVLRGSGLVLVAGDRDRLADPARVAAQRAALEGAGVPCRVLTFDGGHRLDPATLASLRGD
jgi:predicted esterase